MEKLFVYGILREPSTQFSVFSRKVKQEDAVLHGYTLLKNAIFGRYNNIAPAKYDTVGGTLLEITEDELIITDRVEGVAHGLYNRIKIDNWWVYIGVPYGTGGIVD